MSNVLVDKYKLDILANAIANKSGEAVTMTLSGMVQAVDGIETGGGEPNLQTKTYTVDSAGTETITADSGYDGLSEVEVTVPQGEIYVENYKGFYTASGARKWHCQAHAVIETGDSYGTSGFIADHTSVRGTDNVYNAIPTGTTVTPTTSSQTIGGADTMMESAVTVNPIPSQYKDTTDATATADKILQGYTAYANGQKLVGTASGGITPSGTIQITQNGQVDVTQYAIADVNVSGGGTDRLVLLKEQSLGYIQTTSTSETDTGQVIEIDRSVINSYDFLIVQISADTIVNNRHLSSVRTFHLNAASNIDTKNNSGANVVQNHKVSSNGTVTSRSGGTAYGVYPRTLSFGTDISTLPIYKRQSDTYSGAINNDYTCRVYGISFVDLIGG